MQKINVIAFGGLGGNLFSAGLKTILMRLQGVPGIDFRTYAPWGTWKRWGATLQSWRDPTVMLAHSFGVSAAFGAIRATGGRGPNIPLVISFDPSQYWGLQPGLWGSGGNSAPERAARVVNFWQQAPLFAIGNQRVVRDDGSHRNIENVLIGNVIHGAIEDQPLLQQRAVNAIKDVITTLNPPQPKAA